MKIVNVETFLVGNPWKNWLFVQVHTDEELWGVEPIRAFAMKSDPFGSSLGRMTPEDEDLAIDLLAAVREAAGRHALLAIEAHSRFTRSSASGLLSGLNPGSERTTQRCRA